MTKVKIYHLEKTAPKFWYKGFDYAVKNGFSLSNYKLVYSCERENDYGLENAFAEFNINHPADYRAHSLSVSDIVEINGRKWYCDVCGWAEIVELVEVKR